MREQYLIRLWYGTSAVVLTVVFYLACAFAWQVAAVTMAAGLAATFWIVPAIWRRTQYTQPAPNSLRVVIWVTIVLHIIACLTQLAIRDGTEMSAHPDLRGAWIADHRGLWVAAWSTWPFASTSLLWFCRTWVRNFSVNGTMSQPGLVPLGLIALGVVCDLLGESVAACCALPSVQPDSIAHVYRLYQWLSPSVANGLYCFGGLWLNWLACRSGLSSPSANRLGWLVWTTGLGLTWAAMAGYELGVVAFGGVVMALFTLWLIIIDWNLRRR